MEFRCFREYGFLDLKFGYGVFFDYSGCEYCYVLRRVFLSVNVGMGDFWDRILEDSEI